MKRALGVAILLGGLALLALQSNNYLVPVWTGNHYTYPKLGPGLVITNGVLDVAVVSSRQYNVALTQSPDGTFKVTGTKVVIYLNGLRQSEGIDYKLADGVLTPLWEWPPNSVVRADLE